MHQCDAWLSHLYIVCSCSPCRVRMNTTLNLYGNIASEYSLGVSTSSMLGSLSSGCRSAEVLPTCQSTFLANPCCCISPGPNCSSFVMTSTIKECVSQAHVQSPNLLPHSLNNGWISPAESSVVCRRRLVLSHQTLHQADSREFRLLLPARCGEGLQLAYMNVRTSYNLHAENKNLLPGRAASTEKMNFCGGTARMG